jgi:hypothetical protein
VLFAEDPVPLCLPFITGLDLILAITGIGRFEFASTFPAALHDVMHETVVNTQKVGSPLDVFFYEI